MIMYRTLVKRLLDIVLSPAELLVLAIPMLVIAAIVKPDSPGQLCGTRRIRGESIFSVVKRGP